MLPLFACFMLEVGIDLKMASCGTEVWRAEYGHTVTSATDETFRSTRGYAIKFSCCTAPCFPYDGVVYQRKCMSSEKIREALDLCTALMRRAGNVVCQPPDVQTRLPQFLALAVSSSWIGLVLSPTMLTFHDDNVFE
jgi:hypothetical protein